MFSRILSVADFNCVARCPEIHVTDLSGSGFESIPVTLRVFQRVVVLSVTFMYAETL
jgi:hypothetical protein